jgi:hypothetical protein
MGLVSHQNRSSDTYSADESNNSIVGLAGWLFADLLLALAIIFLVGGDIPSISAMSESNYKNDVTIEFTETKDGDAVTGLRKIDQTFDVYVRFSDPVENFAADDIELEPSDEWSVRIVEDSKDVDGKKSYQIRLNPESPTSNELKLTIDQRQVSNASRPNSFNERGQLDISVTICGQIAGIDVDKANVAQVRIPNGANMSAQQLSSWMQTIEAKKTTEAKETTKIVDEYGNEQILREMLALPASQRTQIGFIIIFAGGIDAGSGTQVARSKESDILTALSSNNLVADAAPELASTTCPTESRVPVRAFWDRQLSKNDLTLELYFFDTGK